MLLLLVVLLVLLILDATVSLLLMVVLLVLLVLVLFSSDCLVDAETRQGERWGLRLIMQALDVLLVLLLVLL